MSLQTFFAASRPHLSALHTYTDQMHGKYGGRIGRDMDDGTWIGMTAQEVVDAAVTGFVARHQQEKGA